MLTRHNWIKGVSVDIEGNPCSFANPNIEKMDLTDYIKGNYANSDNVIANAKLICRTIHRDIYDACKTSYTNISGQQVETYPLWKINDLMTWEQIEKLIGLI